MTKESLVIIAVHLLLTLMSSCDSICDDEASVEIQKLATPMLRNTVDDSSMSSTDDSSTRSLSSTPKEEEERVIGKGKKKGKTKASKKKGKKKTKKGKKKGKKKGGKKKAVQLPKGDLKAANDNSFALAARGAD